MNYEIFKKKADVGKEDKNGIRKKAGTLYSNKKGNYILNKINNIILYFRRKYYNRRF